jgi:hypothetical protein
MSFYSQQVVLPDNKLVKLRQKVLVASAKSRVQGILKLGAATHFVTDSNIAVADDCTAHFVGHFAGSFIANPCVDTSSAGEDPKDIFEVKVLIEDVCEDHHCHLHILPTLVAHRSSRAARAHIIVIVHINIKDHFLLKRHECPLVTGIVAVWGNIVDSANINFVGAAVD